METIKYFEHGTEQERITSWQRIINLLDENIPLSQKFIHLGKHYKINSTWEKVLEFIDMCKEYNYIDLIFELDKKFKISVNKCKCRFNNGCNANGMCLNCELKIKQ